MSWAIWSVVEQCAKETGIERFGAHDLRRTCAKLCRKNGGDLEQIKFLLGHSSIQTTERYLGSEQDIEIAVNDNLGLLALASRALRYRRFQLFLSGHSIFRGQSVGHAT